MLEIILAVKTGDIIDKIDGISKNKNSKAKNTGFISTAW